MPFEVSLTGTEVRFVLFWFFGVCFFWGEGGSVGGWGWVTGYDIERVQAAPVSLSRMLLPLLLVVVVLFDRLIEMFYDMFYERERRENFILQGQLSVLTLISVSVPPPCYRSSTYKIPVILPKVQVTAKHAYTLRMWLCMK